MPFCKIIINERLSQIFKVLRPLVLTVQSILAAVYRIDLSGTPCRQPKIWLLGFSFAWKK